MAKRLNKYQRELNARNNISLMNGLFGKEMTISCMGMDISLNGPAFSVVATIGKKKHYFLEMKSGGKRYPKIKQIKILMNKVIKKNCINFVVRESYSFASSFNREVLAEIHGVLMYELFRKQIPVLDVAPMQMKKFICGNHKGDKVFVASTLVREFGLGVLPNDNVSDAYGLSILGYELLRVLGYINKDLPGTKSKLRNKKMKSVKEVFEAILSKKDFSQDLIIW